MEKVDYFFFFLPKERATSNLLNLKIKGLVLLVKSGHIANS